MHKQIWLLMLLAILLIAGTASAQVTQVTISAGDAGSLVTITASGAGAAVVFSGSTSTFCGSTNCISGTALFNPAGNPPQLGTFAMWYANGNNPVISLGGSGYTIGGQVNFFFSTTSGSPGTLQGVLTFSSLGNPTTSGPSFAGTFSTGVNPATGTLLGYWGSGITTNNAALTLNLDGHLPVVDPNTQALNSTTGVPGSGQVYAPQAPTPTPEPASILMLGSGLLALGGTIKRRYFR
jgi:hypothetical protein